ncbi:MAG TPA: hypothetical protein VIK18_02665, partial [Pirellulales bacterium]
MAMSEDPCDPQPARGLPPGWSNPRPQRAYDLAVIGGTRIGVAAALAAVQRGARVALVARELSYEDNSIRWLSGSLAPTAFFAASASWQRQF